MSVPRLVAMGGGGFLMEPRNPRLDSWIVSLARKRRRRRVLLIPTASGDSEPVIERFHRAFAKLDCDTAHLPLFHRRDEKLRNVVLSNDVIYVGGGNARHSLGRTAARLRSG